MSLITCENVKLSYENNTVLSQANFSVESGDYLCVVGEKGSGKSTLIKALLGLKSVNGGKIVYGEGLKPGNVGYLPQQSGAKRDFPASVFEVVLSGCLGGSILPFYTKKQKEKALSNMERLHIKEFKNKCFGELSGGQQQRVLLARALCAADRILLLDEPTAGLDREITKDFYKILAELNNGGITIVCVSHDIEAAVKYANKIMHLKNTPVFYGTSLEYLKWEAENND